MLKFLSVRLMVKKDIGIRLFQNWILVIFYYFLEKRKENILEIQSYNR